MEVSGSSIAHHRVPAVLVERQDIVLAAFEPEDLGDGVLDDLLHLGSQVSRWRTKNGSRMPPMMTDWYPTLHRAFQLHVIFFGRA